MIENKAWYRSKTIWGGLVALAAATAGIFGVEVDGAAHAPLASAAADVAAALGGLLAVFGRLDAKTQIG